MKRILMMLGISLLIAGGLLPLYAEARGATSGRVQGLDQELIRDAQRQLRALGYNPGTVDGEFGAQTEAALRAYQQAYRLPTTGRLDEVTQRSLLPGRFETARPPTDFSDREVILQAQRQLKALGFNPGDIDGNFGSQTEAAVRAYQQKYRLPETGRLEETTQRSLLPGRFEAARVPTDFSDREVILQAQRQLKALGFNPGDIDGNFGPQMEAALRAYQQNYRLPQTGQLDEVTQRSLLPGRFEAARPPTDFSDREVILQAQRQLKALGFNPGDIDGNFGSQTEAAVRAYQQKYRLPETGRLEETTLRSLLPERTQATPAPAGLSDRELVRRAQRQLRALGFDPGGVDGAFGPETAAAVRAYQQNYRLPETGRLDDVTLRSLLPEMRQGALR